MNRISIKDRYGRVVGHVRDGVFRKKVRGSKHKLRSPEGWALGVETIGQAKDAGATVVHIQDLDANQTWVAPLELFNVKGFAFDRGHGTQMALAIEYWRDERQQVLPGFGS